MVGMGQNQVLPGRMAATSQGTNSASQGPVNSDGTLTVQGIAAGQYAYFVVLGCSTPGVGTNMESLAAAYHSGGYTGWIGQSAVSGAILGDGVSIAPASVFYAVRGFLLGAAGLFDGPVIYTQPTNMTISVGSNATLCVGAYAPGTLSYSWYKNSQLISGANSASYQITNATTNDAGQYYVVVSSSSYPNASVTSATATVIVVVPPSISQQPVSQIVTAGTSVSLTVAASGTAPLSYQWYNSSGMILGATNNSLTFNPAQTNNWDNYYVIVSNSFGTVASSPATLIVYQPVTILTQPVSRLVVYGGTATFAVTASGFQPPAYQWFFNGTNGIFSGTNSTLQLSQVQPSQAGTYTVAVTNLFGSVTSSPATLNVMDSAPIIMTPPTNQATWSGATMYFAVNAIGSSPLAYQWFYNGTNVLQGATNALLQLHNVQVSQSGNNAVVVTNLFGAVTSTPAFLSVADLTLTTVTNCTEANLRAAMAGGGTVTFACDGTITLANTISIPLDTVIDGSGHQITISGNNAVRVFYVATNVNFTVVNLTIANGQSTEGAGVFNAGGQLAFTGATFLSNIATNGALPGTNAASCGGAVCNRGGSVILSNCVFIGNKAFGSPSDSYSGSGIAGGDGCGGAIYSASQLNVEGSTFDGNVVRGGAGASGTGSYSYGPRSYAGAGGSANGGAIFVLGTASVSGSTFVGNVAAGGGGGMGGNGTCCTGITGGAGGWGGTGGSGNGAALFIGGSVSLVNCTIASNAAVGAAGGRGGNGDFGESGGSGGWGGAGGAGFGVLCDAGDLAAITNCTIALNASQGGAGGYGGAGGLGPYGNGASGASGTGGIAAGGLRTLGGKLLNTLLATNTPANCSGTITDVGHNLSSDGSCNFTNIGSLNNTNLKLGPLANNGGPTLTMALLPGSPAIDAGSAVGAPATDQRGVPRPQGSGVDIGAFEFQYIPVFSGAKFQSATNFWLQLSGLLPAQAFKLQVSTNLVDWFDLTNFVASANGGCELIDDNAGKYPKRFYRLKAANP
jgi:hypothetical protein